MRVSLIVLLILFFSFSVFSLNINLVKPSNHFVSKSVFVDFAFECLNPEVTDCFFYNSEFGWGPKLSFKLNSNKLINFNYTFSSEGSFEWNILCRSSSNDFWASSKNQVIVIDSINGVEPKLVESTVEVHSNQGSNSEAKHGENNNGENEHEVKHPNIDLGFLLLTGSFFSLVLAGIALALLVKSKFLK